MQHEVKSQGAFSFGAYGAVLFQGRGTHSEFSRVFAGRGQLMYLTTYFNVCRLIRCESWQNYRTGAASCMLSRPPYPCSLQCYPS